MALAESIFVDKCEVVSIASTYITGNQKALTIQVRKADIVTKDGVEIARNYHRHSLTPGYLKGGTGADKDTLVVTNITAEDALVQTIANAVWTADAKEAYRAYLVGIRSEGL